MKKIIKNKGIVINAMTYQETAAIATLITENGKHTCLIKGAKKLNGSNKRLINIPVLIEYQSTVSDSLSVLTEGVVLDNFTNIKDDIIRYNYASIIIEKLLYFSEQITDFKTLYNFTIEILKKLSESNYLNSLVLIFEIKLLYLLGVAPSFNYCPICSKTNYVGSFVNNLGLIVIRMIIRFGGMHLDMEFLILSNPIPIIGMPIIQKVHPSLSFYGDIV